MDEIVNKVAESGIMTLDLAPYLAQATSIAPFDIKPFLFREMILREKDFRASLLTHDWEAYRDKNVALFCSVDAIIPAWGYMLIASNLEGIAQHIYFGTEAECLQHLTLAQIAQIPTANYTDKRVVLKGCGDVDIPAYAYVAATQVLRPVVKSLMYGEPCSTVPVYKQKVGRS